MISVVEEAAAEGRRVARAGQGDHLSRERRSAVFARMRLIRIDYKDVKNLRYFVTERGKIVPSPY